MLALARRNAADAGVSNVHFLKGVIEQIPLPADSVDVVISNCVINLSVDKPAVLTEIARVLKPGGRIGISDVVAEDHLTSEQRAERGSYVGCIAGALSKGEYEAGLEAAGSSRSASSSRTRSPTVCTARSSRRSRRASRSALAAGRAAGRPGRLLLNAKAKRAARAAPPAAPRGHGSSSSSATRRPTRAESAGGLRPRRWIPLASRAQTRS